VNGGQVVSKLNIDCWIESKVATHSADSCFQKRQIGYVAEAFLITTKPLKCRQYGQSALKCFAIGGFELRAHLRAVS
jgi:hypothetical protein